MQTMLEQHKIKTWLKYHMAFILFTILDLIFRNTLKPQIHLISGNLFNSVLVTSVPHLKQLYITSYLDAISSLSDIKIYSNSTIYVYLHKQVKIFHVNDNSI